MIELVLNSKTLEDIGLEHHLGAYSAFSNRAIDSFLRLHNPDAKLAIARANFTNSCAGYCVATYLLGIGDRHPGNIMMTTDGRLFHIDFGHILGNFKKWHGVERERSRFVFTSQMLYAICGEAGEKSKQWMDFKQLCFQALKIFRKNAHHLENLFLLMLPARMPELSSEKDIEYLRSRLCVDLDDRGAEATFEQELIKSLKDWTKKCDDYFHNLKHGK